MSRIYQGQALEQENFRAFRNPSIKLRVSDFFEKTGLTWHDLKGEYRSIPLILKIPILCSLGYLGGLLLCETGYVDDIYHKLKESKNVEMTQPAQSRDLLYNPTPELQKIVRA